MENVVLTVHLILAVLLTGVVLLQRSEGGGLGMGGGGGGTGVMTGRQAANMLTRMTWFLGVALFVTSVTLTVIAARQTSNSSIMDQLGVPASQQNNRDLPQLPSYTPPPMTGGDPLTPPIGEAPAATAPGSAAPEAAAPAAATPETAAPETAAPSAPAADALTPPAAEAPAAEAPATQAPAAEAPAAETPSTEAPSNAAPDATGEAPAGTGTAPAN